MSKFTKMNSGGANVVLKLPCTAKHGRFFDVHIICNDACYGAHKFILALQSNYLKELFLTITQESQNSQDTCKIVMDDLKEIDVENILNYIYDGEIGVTKSNVCGFLQAGKYLRLDTITDLMEENEEFNLNSDMCHQKFGTTNDCNTTDEKIPLLNPKINNVQQFASSPVTEQMQVAEQERCESRIDSISDISRNEEGGTFHQDTVAFSVGSHYCKTPSASSVWTFGETVDSVYELTRASVS